MSVKDDYAASVYETRLVDFRTAETTAQLLFGDLEDAKHYLESYALIRYNATSTVWQPRRGDRREAYAMDFDEAPLRGLIQARAIYPDSDPLVEAVRETHAETGVDTLA